MTWTPTAYPSQDAARAAVVAEALTWLNTPWHHRAHRKGVGVDCAQLPLAVYANAGLLEWADTGDYPRDWHLHRGDERFIPGLERWTGEIAREAVRPGDILVVRIGRVFSHGAIVLDWPQVIHAHVRAGRVVLGDASRDRDLADRPQRFFGFWAPGGEGARDGR